MDAPAQPAPVNATFNATQAWEAQQAADTALINTLILAGIVALIFIVLFLLLRPCMKYFYTPWPVKFNKHQHHKLVQTPPKTLFGWIKPTLFVDDETFLKCHGLDSFMYISFLRTFVVIFLISFVFNWILLIPVDGTAARATSPQIELRVSGLSVISIANINPADPIDQWRLIAHVISLIVMSISVYVGLVFWYRRYLFCRLRILNSKLPSNFTVRVDGLGSKETKESLSSFFQTLFPDRVAAVHLVPFAPSARSYLANLKVYKHELSQVHYSMHHDPDEANKNVRAVPAPLLCCSTSPCCCCYESVDAIEHYSKLIEKYEKKVSKFDGKMESTSVAYVTFKSIHDARLCARTVMGRVLDLRHWTVVPAVDPDEVLWGNHEVSPNSRLFRRICTSVVSFFSIILWIVPTTFAVSLANTTVLSNLGPFAFLESVITLEALKGIIEGIIPAIIVFIFAELLLLWLGFLTKTFEAHRSRSGEMLSLLIKFFSFQIVDIFLPSLLGGGFMGILEQLVAIAQQPFLVIPLLGGSVPRQVTFFINYVALQSVVANLFGLVRPIDLVIYLGKRFCCIKSCRATSKRERRALKEPPEFEFAAKYSTDLLVATMGLVYSSISPLIAPFALFYFGLNWLCSRYNHLYPCIFPYTFTFDVSIWRALTWLCFFRFVFSQRQEGWGRAVPLVMSITLITVTTYQLTMIGIFIINSFILGSVCGGILVLTTFLFWIFVQRTYRHRASYGILDASLSGEPSSTLTDLGPHFSFFVENEEDESSSEQNSVTEEESRMKLPLEFAFEDPIVQEIRLIRERHFGSPSHEMKVLEVSDNEPHSAASEESEVDEPSNGSQTV